MILSLTSLIYRPQFPLWAQSTSYPRSRSTVPAVRRSSIDLSENQPALLKVLALTKGTPSVSCQAKGKAQLPLPHLSALTFRVRPEQVTHGPVVRHLLLSVNCPDLVQGLDGRGEAPVHAEDLQRGSKIGGKGGSGPVSPIPLIPMEPCGQPTLPSMIADRLR